MKFEELGSTLAKEDSAGIELRYVRNMLHYKQDRVTIQEGLPLTADGKDGDIRFCVTDIGIKLLIKVASQWVAFASEFVISDGALQGTAPTGTLHFIHGGWGDGTSSSTLWLPFRTPDADDVSGNARQDVKTTMGGGGTDNAWLGYVFPYNGKVKKISVRSSGEPGECYFRVYKAGDTVANADTSTGTLISTASGADMSADDVTHTFNFPSANVKAGEVISILCIPESSQSWGDVAYTLVLEYDI